MFADAKVEIAAAVAGGFDVAGVVEREASLCRRRQIRGASDKPRHALSDGVQHFAGCVAASDTFGIGREARDVGVPSCRQLALLYLFEMIGKVRILALVIGELRHPGYALGVTTLTDQLLKPLVHAIRHQKLGIFGPTVISLGQLYFFFAQRLAVRRTGILLVRSAVGNVAVDDDERGPVRGGLEGAKSPREHF